MNTRLIALPLTMLTVLLASCATSFSPIHLDPVGPDGPATTHTASGTTGTLAVYSGLDLGPNAYPDDYFSHYSDYAIWSPDGSKLVRLVSNRRLVFSDDEPTRVVLKPGEYLVKATTESYNLVMAPVVVVAGQITILHLDGGLGVDKNRSSLDKVYLPDGEIVGHRMSKGS